MHKLDRRIVHISNLILADLKHQWTNPEIAARVNMSVPHFQRLFKSQLLTTPAAFIENARLDRAEVLLVSEEFPAVKQVLFEVGLPDDRSFKKRNGLTPAQFCKLHWDRLQAGGGD